MTVQELIEALGLEDSKAEVNIIIPYESAVDSVQRVFAEDGKVIIEGESLD